MRRLLLHLAVGTAVPALVLSLGASTGASAAAPTAANRFAPVSASFVSAGTGFVLGTRGCARSSCAARLVKTTNGGRTWTALPAPAVPLTGPRQATRTVRFADSGNGWLFNPGLWATHNGGRHWQRIYLPGTVVAMAASAGTVLASVSPYTGGPSRLYQSPAGTSRWTLVPGVVPAGHLTLYGHAGWAGSEPGLWGTTDLRHWHKLPPLKSVHLHLQEPRRELSVPDPGALYRQRGGWK